MAKRPAFPIKLIDELSQLAAVATRNNWSKSKLNTVSNQTVNKYKALIKKRLIFEISRVSGKKYEDWKSGNSIDITRGQRIEKSYQYTKNKLNIKVLQSRVDQKKAIKHFKNKNFHYLEKYGIKKTDRLPTARKKIAAYEKKITAQKMKKFSKYAEKRLVVTETQMIKNNRQKEWADKTGNELVVIPHPDYCPVCAPYVKKRYPTEIKRLPPYHPLCRCEAKRLILLKNWPF